MIFISQKSLGYFFCQYKLLNIQKHLQFLNTCHSVKFYQQAYYEILPDSQFSKNFKIHHLNLDNYFLVRYSYLRSEPFHCTRHGILQKPSTSVEIWPKSFHKNSVIFNIFGTTKSVIFDIFGTTNCVILSFLGILYTFWRISLSSKHFFHNFFYLYNLYYPRY